jgi:hypothetical protein
MKTDTFAGDAARKREAAALLNSVRGRYLMGRALALAIKSMRAERHPQTENIEDMELLGNELFAFGYRLEIVKGSAQTC